MTVYSVADRAGVSIATVSRVQRGLAGVAPETRERVLRAIGDLGYRPNRFGAGLAGSRHGATGIVFPDLSGPYYSEIILGYEGESVARGDSLLILGTHGREDSSELVLDLAARVDALLLMDKTVPDDVVRALTADGLPVALLGRAPVAGVPSVRAENVGSARLLVTHLLHDHGYGDVAFLGDPDGSRDAAERWEGFLAAHAAAGLDPRPPVRTSVRGQDGYAGALGLLRGRDRPRALVCTNDESALGAMGAAKEVGARVPEDLAVTGWDDIPLARYLPVPLTTVHQPMRRLGAEAARLVHALLDGASDPKSPVLPTELVVRASCGCTGGIDVRPEEGIR